MSNPALTRRQVLGGIGALSATALPASAGIFNRKVAIVGGGMAGVALAWLIEKQRDVVLLEAKPTLGGNVQTVPIDLNGQTYQVDMGAQYFHPKLYTFYVRLLKQLGLYPTATLQSHSFPASISLYDGSEPLPRFVSPVLPDRFWPIVAPWNWEGLGAFGATFPAAKTREQQNGDWNVTLDDWLQTLGLNTKQREGMILPWAASLFTGNTAQAKNFSARAAMIFAATSIPDFLTDPILSYVLNQGLKEPIERLVTQMPTVQIMTGAEVTNISRRPQGGFLLQCADGRQTQADDLVMAASGPASLALLQGIEGTGPQRTALQGIEFAEARLALHTDPAYAPKDPDHWSFLNCQVHGGYCEASMWLTKVLTSYATPPNLWKSWVTFRDQQPNNVLHQTSFRHMVPSIGTLQAQIQLKALQGNGGIWFAGGYTQQFDSQETALTSAIDVSFRLNTLTARAISLFFG